ncbi:MAG: penicillin acylase family protein [bacterium]|nr:penicillin acylase family protein [bacterium]
MKLLRKILKVAAILLTVLIVVLAVLGFWFVRRPWPEVSGTLVAEGLQAEIEVIRDRWGVPHIYAANEHDLFFAQGYVHAQDRLWQMELNRLVGSGSLAKVLGPGLVPTDRFMRTLGLRRAAEKDWEMIDQETRELLEAYAAGINHFVDTHRSRLPLEFTALRIDPEPWTPIDSLNWVKLMSLNLSLNGSWEIIRMHLRAKLGDDAVAQLLPPYADGPLIIPPEARQPLGTFEADAAEAPPVVGALLGEPGMTWGSNSWVVHGSRTATGQPLLANDTHLGLSLPSIWYENGLHGGRFNDVGFSFAGMPLVVIGHNGRIAWGITNMCTDVQDYFIERFDAPDNPTKYEFQGEWRELELIPETIEVKGAEPVTFNVVATHHGPIMNQVNPQLAQAEPMALRWPALDGGRLVEALMQLNLADDWQEFQDALSLWDAPSVNFSYADVAGNVGYQATGRIPIRPPGDLGLMPKPGWSGEYEWQGFVPFAEVPRSFNPPAGFIVTANNKVVDDDYPYHLAHDMADPYRARRITEVLAADQSVAIADVRALHADVYSLPAATLRPYLLAVEPEDELQKRALAEVEAWEDLELRVDSPGATVYKVWIWHLWQYLLADELGNLFPAYRQQALSQIPLLIDFLAQPQSPWFDDTTTPEVETRDDIVRRSLADAVAWLAERYGTDPAGWEWGTVHPMTFAHAPFGQSGIGPLESIFNSDPLPLGGDTFTVNAGLYNLDDPFAVIFGVSQRLIVDLDDLSKSLAINSTGQCAHVFHRHREDQIPMWGNVEYHPVLFSREAVEAEAEATLTLVPQ